MESRLIQAAKRDRLLVYGVAVVAGLGGLLVRLPLFPALEAKVPFITFFLATAVSATFGGFGPGLLTTLLGAILAALFVIPSGSPFVLIDPADYLSLALFIGFGGFISFLSGRLIEARQRESALRLLFQQTLRSIGDGVISAGRDRRVLLMNHAAEQLTGWGEGEAKGQPLRTVFRVKRESSSDSAELPLDEVMETGNTARIPGPADLLTKSGRRIAIEESSAPIRDQTGTIQGAVFAFRDVTERRQAQRDLEKAERRARTILESITDSFILLDRDWRYSYVNPAAEKIVQTPAASLIGRNYWETRPPALAALPADAFRKAVSTQEPVTFEHHNPALDQWLDLAAYPSDEGLSIYLRDITERKRSEDALRRLNEDLRHFTYAATHDIRDPLRMVLTYSQLVERKLAGSLDPETANYLTNVMNGGRHIERLIDSLIQYSRLGEAEKMEPVESEAESAVKDALRILEPAIEDCHASIVHSRLPKVWAEPTHLSQLFQNLIGNAIKYRREEVPLEIAIHATLSRDEWTFAVHDNGQGIQPEYCEQIFLPFKRLHGADIPGAGIGLAACRRIVERYGGRIWVESDGATGSTFFFTLPAAKEQEAASATS